MSRAVHQLDISLVLRDEMQKYGFERMLQSLRITRQFHIYDSMAEAVQALDNSDRPHLFIVAVREIPPKGPCLLDHVGGRGAKLLLLLDDSDPTQLDRATTLRADGFLHTHELSTRMLGEAIERVSSGEVPIPPRLAKTLLKRVREGAQPPEAKPSPLISLTSREQQVLVLLVEGMSNKQIARRLGISVHGAKRLVANILAKLHCPNRTLAVTKALRSGLMPGHESHNTAS
jgi:DNA-binding NarL/FixJ family response regulator